jgi:hypothetical protein
MRYYFTQTELCENIQQIFISRKFKNKLKKVLHFDGFFYINTFEVKIITN